jgi:hypothetical protein
VALKLTEGDMEFVAKAEIKQIDELQEKLKEEFEGGQLTTAQRIGALSEIRKCIQFRCVLEGLVEPSEGSDIY